MGLHIARMAEGASCTLSCALYELKSQTLKLEGLLALPVTDLRRRRGPMYPLLYIHH